MNMPDPMNKSSFNSLNEEIANSYNYIAEASMNDAAKEVRIISLKENYDDHIVIDEDILGDGAWQKRGYSSLNGFVTIISKTNGKCIDYCILSKKCKSCEYWNAHKGSSKYMMFKVMSAQLITKDHLDQWRQRVLLNVFSHLLRQEN